MEKLECSVCHESFSHITDEQEEKTPIVGNCGHNVCRSCLPNLQAAQSEFTNRKVVNIKCPECRMPSFRLDRMIPNYGLCQCLQVVRNLTTSANKTSAQDKRPAATSISLTTENAVKLEAKNETSNEENTKEKLPKRRRLDTKRDGESRQSITPSNGCNDFVEEDQGAIPVDRAQNKIDSAAVSQSENPLQHSIPAIQAGIVENIQPPSNQSLGCDVSMDDAAIPDIIYNICENTDQVLHQEKVKTKEETDSATTPRTETTLQNSACTTEVNVVENILGPFNQSIGQDGSEDEAVVPSSHKNAPDSTDEVSHEIKAETENDSPADRSHDQFDSTTISQTGAPLQYAECTGQVDIIENIQTPSSFLARNDDTGDKDAVLDNSQNISDSTDQVSHEVKVEKENDIAVDRYQSEIDFAKIFQTETPLQDFAAGSSQNEVDSATVSRTGTPLQHGECTNQAGIVDDIQTPSNLFAINDVVKDEITVPDNCQNILDSIEQIFHRAKVQAAKEIDFTMSRIESPFQHSDCTAQTNVNENTRSPLKSILRNGASKDETIAQDGNQKVPASTIQTSYQVKATAEKQAPAGSFHNENNPLRISPTETHPRNGVCINVAKNIRAPSYESSGHDNSVDEAMVLDGCQNIPVNPDQRSYPVTPNMDKEMAEDGSQNEIDPKTIPATKTTLQHTCFTIQAGVAENTENPLNIIHRNVKVISVVNDSNQNVIDSTDQASDQVKVKTEKEYILKERKEHRKYGKRKLLARQSNDGMMKLGGGNVAMELYPKDKDHKRFSSKIGNRKAVCYHDSWQPFGPKYAGQEHAHVMYIPDCLDHVNEQFSVFMRRSNGTRLYGWEYVGDYYCADPEEETFTYTAAHVIPQKDKRKMVSDIAKSIAQPKGTWHKYVNRWRKRLEHALKEDACPAGPGWLIKRRRPTEAETKQKPLSMAARARALGFHPEVDNEKFAQILVELDEFHHTIPIKFVKYDEVMYDYVKGGETTRNKDGKKRSVSDVCAKASDWYQISDQQVF